MYEVSVGKGVQKCVGLRRGVGKGMGLVVGDRGAGRATTLHL